MAQILRASNQETCTPRRASLPCLTSREQGKWWSSAPKRLSSTKGERSPGCKQTKVCGSHDVLADSKVLTYIQQGKTPGRCLCQRRHGKPLEGMRKPLEEMREPLEEVREPLKLAHHTYNRNLDCALAPCVAKGNPDLFTLYLLSDQITGLCPHAVFEVWRLNPGLHACRMSTASTS